MQTAIRKNVNLAAKKSRPWHQCPMQIAALQCNFENDKTMEAADRWARYREETGQTSRPGRTG